MADPWTTYWMYGAQQHSPHAQVHGAPAYYYTPTAAAAPLPSPGAPMWMQPPQAQYVPPAPVPAIPGVNPAKLVNGFQSMKYPELHPTLATDTSMIKYDVRYSPKDGISHATYHAVKPSFALAKPVDHLRLVSPDFPWSIELKGNPRNPITVEYIWEALYGMLQANIEDSEWGLLCLGSGDARADKKKREAIKAATERRLKDDKKAKDKKAKRVDWLGEATIFKGLERDAAFIKNRLPIGAEEAEETWIVRMAT